MREAGVGTIERLSSLWAPLLFLVGCSSPETPTSTTNPTRSGAPGSLYERQAREALRSIGIDREPVRVMQIPMALDRLLVVLASLNPEVSDLAITMVQMEHGWRLQSPPMDELAEWLHMSRRK